MPPVKKAKGSKKPPKEKVTGFSVTGEFMTQQARNFWIEREFSRAYKILDCLIGVTRDQQEQILQGKKKLIGVNSLELVNDDWTPPEDYLSLHAVLDFGRNMEELRRYRMREAEEILQRAYQLGNYFSTGELVAEIATLRRQAVSLIGQEEVDALDEERKRIMAERPDPNVSRPPRRVTLQQLEDEERGEEEDAALDERVDIIAEELESKARSGSVSNMFEEDAETNRKGRFSALELAQMSLKLKMEMAGLDVSVMADANVIMNRGFDIEPALCPDMSSQSGWLLPDGKYYPCKYMEHIGLSSVLLKKMGVKFHSNDSERKAEQLGWIKLAKTLSGWACLAFKVPTKKQTDKLWDYAKKHNRDYEEMTCNLPKSNDFI